VDFLQAAHRQDERYTVRDGINIARYVLKMASDAPGDVGELLVRAVSQILGEEGLDYLPG